MTPSQFHYVHGVFYIHVGQKLPWNIRCYSDEYQSWQALSPKVTLCILVPVIIPKELKEPLAYLANPETRGPVIKENNQYLFASSGKGIISYLNEVKFDATSFIFVQ